MNTYYTNERNVQILISLLKEYKVKKVIVSPGTTNITFVASIQQDPYFDIFSSADERSAAYIACGLAAESGEPVALSCTGATASRNYIPGLTEAYYRQLPVVAITACHRSVEIGQHKAQVLDRTQIQNDIARTSVLVPFVHDKVDEWNCILKINKALTEMRRHGGGPVHINIESVFSKDYSIQTLPKARKIDYFSSKDSFPSLPKGRIVIYCASHLEFSKELQNSIDRFVESNNSVVLCDKTSNYKGKYAIQSALVFSQKYMHNNLANIDLLIHIGGISGEYYTTTKIKPKEVWRVNEDGEIRDTFEKLTKIFEVKEDLFFQHYTKENEKDCSLFQEYLETYQSLSRNIPDLPFSNLWVAQQLSNRLPHNSVLHLGILNSLRSWNFFEIDNSIMSYSNVGGFGIDGDMSALLGASLFDRSKLYFGVLGDLAFFYDMNSLGNHNVGNNLRIVLINNGRGVEFRNYSHDAHRFGEMADEFIAAAGHYGNMSHDLIRHYSSDLGFEYLSATSKEDFIVNVDRFLTPEITEKPILFEIFTEVESESNALWMINHVESKNISDVIHDNITGVKQVAGKILGDKVVKSIKTVLK